MKFTFQYVICNIRTYHIESENTKYTFLPLFRLKTISIIEIFQEQGVSHVHLLLIYALDLNIFPSKCLEIIFRDEEATEIAIIIMILFDTQLKQQKKFCKTLFALRVVEGPCFFSISCIFVYQGFKTDILKRFIQAIMMK